MNRIFIYFPLLVLFTALCVPSKSFAVGKGFYPDGKLKWEYVFQDGEISEAKWYNEDGILVSKELYINGKPVKTFALRLDGTMEWLMRPVGEHHQEITRFDEQGNITTKYTMIENQPDGEHTIFYANGKPRQIVTYRAGILEGPAKTYFPSGQVEHDFFYKNGEVDGAYKTYSEEGVLLTEYTFSKGTLQ